MALVREGEEPARGEEVAIAVDPASVLVFPGGSGGNSDANVMPRGGKVLNSKRFT